MVVKYQVERRPIGPSGKVYYGKGYGDFITVLTDPDNSRLKTLKTGGAPQNKNGISYRGTRIGEGNQIFGANSEIPELSGEDPMTHFMELSGEPWLVFSSHHAVDAAIAAAAPLAAAIGATNVRIIKVLSHTTEFKLN